MALADQDGRGPRAGPTGSGMLLAASEPSVVDVLVRGIGAIAANVLAAAAVAFLVVLLVLLLLLPVIRRFTSRREERV